MKSRFFSLDTKDFIKGLVVSTLTAVVTFMYTTLQSGVMTFDWKSIGMAALSAGLAYIMKNLVTNSNDELFKNEPKATEEP